MNVQKNEKGGNTVLLCFLYEIALSAVFAYFNTSVGINPVIQKLPVGIQNKWRDRAISYKKQSNTVFPPFSFFCTFIQEIASTLNDPGFDLKVLN
jgi:hypothetical protein